MENLLEKIKDLSILIVDDDDLIIDAMYHLIRRRVKKVDTALNGQEALALFKSNTYDIIISDIEMPEMNGYQLHDAIIKEAPETNFLFLSGHASDEIEERFRHLIITKPIDKEQLLEKIAGQL